jgi:hypothetical protein
MTTLVVTVAWRGRRRDLAVPADVPVADLLWPLATALVGGDAPSPGSGGVRQSAAGPGGELALAPLGGAPLPADRTLGVCGIGDGAVLVLIDGLPPSVHADRST